MNKSVIHSLSGVGIFALDVLLHLVHYNSPGLDTLAIAVVGGLHLTGTVHAYQEGKPNQDKIAATVAQALSNLVSIVSMK